MGRGFSKIARLFTSRNEPVQIEDQAGTGEDVAPVTKQVGKRHRGEVAIQAKGTKNMEAKLKEHAEVHPEDTEAADTMSRFFKQVYGDAPDTEFHTSL